MHPENEVPKLPGLRSVPVPVKSYEGLDRCQDAEQATTTSYGADNRRNDTELAQYQYHGHKATVENALGSAEERAELSTLNTNLKPLYLHKSTQSGVKPFLRLLTLAMPSKS